MKFYKFSVLLFIILCVVIACVILICLCVELVGSSAIFVLVGLALIFGGGYALAYHF